MRVRWIGLTLALAVTAGAVGYAVGDRGDTEPRAFGAPTTIPASDPALPFEVIDVRPDPIYPTLRPGVPLVKQSVDEEPFVVTVQAPRGWVRSNPTSSEWRWYPGDPDDTKNTYFVRLRVVSNTFSPVPKSLEARISALDEDPSAKNLDVEQRDDDSFVATYVLDGYRRLSMERFFPDDDGFAYVSLAVIGRMQDRDGVADLFARMSAGVRLPT